MNWFRKLTLLHKFSLIVAALLLPVAMLMWFFARTEISIIRTAEQELLGARVLLPIAELPQQVARHRLLAVQGLAGNDAAATEARALRADIDRGLAAFEAEADAAATLGITSQAKEVTQEWRSLAAATDSLSATELVERHEVVLASIRAFNRVALDESLLMLDPDMDTYHLMSAGLDQSPAVLGVAAKTTFVAALGTEAGIADPRLELYGLASQIPLLTENLVDTYAEGIEANAAVHGSLKVGLDDFAAKIQRLHEEADDVVAGKRSARDIVGLGTSALAAGVELQKAATQHLIEAIERRVHEHRSLLYTQAGIALFAVAAAVLIAVMTIRGVNSRVNRAIAVFGRISSDQYDNDIRIDSEDETGKVLMSLKDMQEKLKDRVARERAEAQTTMRLKQALDNASANVMVADESLNIAYLNKSAVQLFRTAEADLRKDLPQFSAENLIGTNIDRFHRNPSHQHRILAGLKSMHTAEFNVGGRTMAFRASPILDESDHRIGVIVEWTDRTTEVRTEQELESVIRGAVDGNLALRLTKEGKSGFFGRLTEQMNALLDTNQQVFGDLDRVLGALAQGRLTERMHKDYKGAYGEIKNAVNTTVDKLTETVQQIQLSADLVTSGAQEIAKGNEDLSRRTESQASALEETASSMEEMTSTVKHNADNTAQANQLAAAARGAAQKGGDVVGKAVVAMAEINSSSRKIADIIGVIDEIAFQTNLLALNAAVEAARAGEQGRGFAVVASEVRNLASRSAEAAKQIKALIEDSVRKVDDGTRLVDESGRTLEEIVTGVKKVTDLIAEISAAGREQAAGIDEVNRAVMQMDEGTQQNAALVEQAAAATENLSDQATMLAQLVSFFDLGNAGQQRRAAPAVAGSRPVAVRSAAVKSAPIKRAASAAGAEPARSAAPDGDGVDWERF